MESTEKFRKALERIAAAASGQVPNVRTVLGRQLQFLHNPGQLFVLPHSQGDELVVMDTASSDYGAQYFIVDIHPIDHTDYPIA